MARRGDAPDDRYDDDYNDDFEGRRPRRRGRDSRSPGRERPPFLLRFFSWIGIILLCFVAGYLGTSWMVRSLNTRSLLKPENRVENGEDLKALTESEKKSSACYSRTRSARCSTKTACATSRPG